VVIATTKVALYVVLTTKYSGPLFKQFYRATVNEVT